MVSMVWFRSVRVGVLREVGTPMYDWSLLCDNCGANYEMDVANRSE